VTRIVAGVAGGRRLTVPPRGTRPTAERVREALFSALDAAMDLDGAAVLDLYAGSGALGLEALSRGAARAVFVESERAALAVLRRNVDAVGVAGALVVPGRVRTVLEAGPPDERPCELVLADPPYAVSDRELRAVLDAVVGRGWTRPGTIVVVERASRSSAPHWPAPLEALRSKRYGDTELHWARHEPAPV
jgi:16S rRNA (guanine966-N2)-methyltransferase